MVNFCINKILRGIFRCCW